MHRRENELEMEMVWKSSQDLGRFIHINQVLFFKTKNISFLINFAMPV